jgi:Gram-negative bacterial tonB protein.
MFKRENNAGIYLTVSVHLLALIVLLLLQIRFELQQEAAFVLDFSQLEERERQEQRAQMRAEVAEELDALFANRGERGPAPRNVAVDVSQARQNLNERSFQGRSEVYDEAKALQDKLDASRRAAEALQGSDDIPTEKKEEKKEEQYVGPSVISYLLEGRKALSLPIPVYKCIGGGDVSVSILVNPNGYVVAAEVTAGVSSSDECLREYALRAARSSRFTAKSNAPRQQAGEIVYRFVAQ